MTTERTREVLGQCDPDVHSSQISPLLAYVEELERALSDETHKQARLARIAELALIDIRTHSRDVDDYLETLEYIAGIANGLKEPK
jgi:hypothetical protein